MYFKRIDRPERVRAGKTIKASYTVFCYADDDTEIAYYDSREDELYLNASELKSSTIAEMEMPYEKRIEGGKHEKELKVLMIAHKNVSEYMTL